MLTTGFVRFVRARPSSSLLKQSVQHINAINSTSSASRNSSTRSWSVTQYHHDLKQSVRLLEHSAMPVLHRPSDVLVRVHAASVNPLDLAMARGYGQVFLTAANIALQTGIDRITYGRLPLALGRDFVGEVLATGHSVSKFKPGDRVWGTVPPYYEGGSHADHLVTCDTALWYSPKNLSPVQAASIPYVGLTAWSALVNFGQLGKPRLNSSTTATSHPKRCLILGAGGGVGCFSAQLLKNCYNAHLVATCSERSFEWLRSLVPVDQLVDYREFGRFLHGYAGEDFDLVLDASPAAAARVNLDLISSWKANRSSPRNHLTTYLTLSSPLLSNLDAHGIVSGSLKTAADALCDTIGGLRHGLSVRWAYYVPDQAALASVTDLVERGQLKPFTGEVFAFEQALEAYECAENHSDGKMNDGKVVLQLTS